MSAYILLTGQTAVFDGEKWTYPDKSMQDLLNLTIPEVDGSDPNPDKTAAQYVVDNFGGEIVKVDSAEFVKGTIY